MSQQTSEAEYSAEVREALADIVAFLQEHRRNRLAQQANTTNEQEHTPSDNIIRLPVVPPNDKRRAA